MTTLLRRLIEGIGFCLYFLRELLVANLRIAIEVLTPERYRRMRPAIVAMPLAAKTDIEITVLANLISLTPGTLSLDVSHDRDVLSVHVVYWDGVESLKDFERRLLRVFR